MEVKTIGILTSGGDSQGMNAAIRAIVRNAVRNGIKVKGIFDGYQGLIDGNFIDLDIGDVSGIIQKGGTMLGTARCLAFKEPAGIQQAADNCRKFGIDGLVVIGGDGSFRGAGDLSRAGIPCVGLPGTIDNDIACTEYTIGFDTAMNVAMEAIDKIRDTIASHHRCAIVEVMGARAGWVALEVGIATGASYIAMPENILPGESPRERYERIKKEIAERLKEGQEKGRKNFTVVVAEAVTSLNKVATVEEMAHEVMEMTGIDTRGTCLGHIQRGGSPTVRDRIAATRMGYHAVQILKKGIGNRVVGEKNGVVYDMDIQEGLAMKKALPEDLLDIWRKVGY